MPGVYADSGNSSRNVTTQANATGLWDWVMEIQPDKRGTLLAFIEAVKRGKVSGIPIYADLKSGPNTDLPVDKTQVVSYLLAQAVTPGD